MKVTVEYERAVSEINDKIDFMVETYNLRKSYALLKAGKAIVTKVKKILPRSKIEDRFRNMSPHYQYNKSQGYIHMADDVKAKVRASKKGDLYVSVGGGKYTGYKWLWIDEGWTMRDGKFHPGIHFIDRAVSESETDIESAIDSLIEEIIA